jgi:hypothetical protein
MPTSIKSAAHPAVHLPGMRASTGPVEALFDFPA